MIVTFILMSGFVVFWLIMNRNLELRQERNDAYDYILSQWRKGLLSQPMGNKLAEKLCEYDGEGKS